MKMLMFLTLLLQNIRGDDSLYFVFLVLLFFAAIISINYFIRHFRQIKSACISYIEQYYAMLSRDEE
jgi:hypothetical protein